MNIREKFEKETNLKVEVTHRVITHSVTVVNPEYVKWLEKQIKDFELFREFIRTEHLTAKWELYLK